MPNTLLSTKLYIPPAPPKLVLRPRLTKRLDEATSTPYRLTLLSAPAGFGKTTLLSEWIRQTGRPTAWISLDKGDNDPARFFAYLIAALQTVQAGVGQMAAALLQSPQPPPAETILAMLINEIASLPARPSNGQPAVLVLVLDDYHVIQAASIHSALAFLLDNLPAQMHLIIATRSDPPIALARLRARGQLAEIRTDDLRLTSAESALFLNRVMDLDLPQEEIAALETRTEGWVTGLQLAALSMRGRDDTRQFVESFIGSNRYILDYLIEEVFQRQSADVQKFLLQTSILDRFSAPLCDAIRDRDDSHTLIQTLEQANLFILPLDESRQWYRYHHLFADLLRHQLETTAARDVPALCRRASEWYQANGFTADAVHHAVAARDWARAADLIGGANELMLMRGEVTTLLNWLKALPDEIPRANLRLCIAYSWALILTGHSELAESYLKQAEAISQEAVPLRGDIYAAQAYIARARGDHPTTIELSQRALSYMPAEALAQRSVVTVNLGIAYLNSGRLAEGELALAEAERAAQQSGNHHVRLIALTFLGSIQVLRGRLHRGEEFFREAIAAGGESPAAAFAHLEYGALLYEWNDLPAAAEHLQRGLELSRRGGNPEIQNSAYRNLALLKQAQGDASAAHAVIEKAHQFAREQHLPPVLCAAIAASHVQIALAQNDLPTAARWADQFTQDAIASPLYPSLGLVRARLLIAQKQNAAAAAELANCFESVARLGWEGGLITVRILQSLAAETGRARLEFLSDALRRGRPEGYLRVFADAGDGLVPLLEEAAVKGISPEYAGTIMAAMKRKPKAATPLVEPLSEREIQVVRLMAAGLSNQAIARKLTISLGTAKTHVHNIFGKLEAGSRTQAVDRARELGIV